MKIRIIRPTIALKRQVSEGEILDVTQQEATELIGARKAVAVKEDAVETAVRSMEQVETSEIPAANTESFAPVVKRGKTKKASE